MLSLFVTTCFSNNAVSPYIMVSLVMFLSMTSYLVDPEERLMEIILPIDSLFITVYLEINLVEYIMIALHFLWYLKYIF